MTDEAGDPEEPIQAASFLEISSQLRHMFGDATSDDKMCDVGIFPKTQTKVVKKAITVGFSVRFPVCRNKFRVVFLGAE